MKALLYKEFKLAMHPICYLFLFLFPFMILIPSYPIGIGFIYLLSCYPILFLGANKGQQSNDLLYSTLLPVRKKDIVLARLITVIIMQVVYILLMSALYPAADAAQSAIAASALAKSQKASTIPGLGLDAYVSVLAITILGFALADLIFFPIYYKKGKSIVMSTVLTIFGFAIYLCFFTIGLPYASAEYLAFMSGDLGIQFALLGGGVALSAALHFVVFKLSADKLEKVDF